MSVALAVSSSLGRALRVVTRQPVGLIAVVFLGMLLALSSGRLAGADPGAQLQVSELIVYEGAIGADRPPDDHLWLAGPDGRYYQVHDLGNVILMLPAVAIGRLAGLPMSLGNPPEEVRFLVSITYALFAAIALTALYLALRSRTGRATASFLLTLLFVFGTLFLAYQKTAFDALGACLGTCLLLAALAYLLRLDPDVDRRASLRAALLAGLALGLTGLFRYTLLPFLALGVAGTVIAQLGWRRSLRVLVPLSLAAFLVTLPTFAYNELRVGNPLLPSNSQYVDGDLSRGLLEGLTYNVVSLREGLLAYSPVFLLVGVVVARDVLEAVRSRLGGVSRDRPSVPRGHRFVWLLIAVGAYTCFIAKVPYEDTTGWGPRYLLPIMPILLVYIAPFLLQALRGRWRRPVLALLVVSVVVSAPPLFTSWNDDLVEYHEDVRNVEPMFDPVPQKAVLTSLAVAVRGRDRYEHGFVERSGIRASDGQALPDFWWRQAMARGAKEGAAVMLFLAFLLGAMVAALTRLRRLVPLRA